jgi:hypothetical protein
MWIGDPFLMLAEMRRRELHEEARRDALEREARAGLRGRRTSGAGTWIGRTLGIGQKRAPLHAARLVRLPGRRDGADLGPEGRRPAA